MMKKNVYSVLVIGLFLFLLSCNNHCVQQIEPEERIQKGDILFVKLPMDYSIYDDSTTVSTKVADNSNNKNMNYIHVAILDVEKDDIWVIDATIKHGVDRYPLDTFLCDFTLQNGKYPTFEIMRLKDTSHIALYIEQAKKYIGCDYDVDFSLDNMAQYCSELVRNAYLSPDSEYIFEVSPMDFKINNGDYPTYWIELFNLINKPIPQDKIGILPQQMIANTNLKTIDVKINL